MKLAFQLLNNVQNVNSFKEVLSLSLVQGNADKIYFRLVDMDQKTADGEYLRYVPVPGYTVQISFVHIDSNQNISRSAVQPYPSDDRSILYVDVLAGESLQPNSMNAVITESGVNKNLIAVSDLKVEPIGKNKFFC